jgi:hypothetical protein
VEVRFPLTGDHVLYNNNSNIETWGPVRAYTRGRIYSASSGDNGDHVPEQIRSSTRFVNSAQHNDNNAALMPRHHGDHVPAGPLHLANFTAMSGIIFSGNNAYQALCGNPMTSDAAEELEAELFVQ